MAGGRIGGMLPTAPRFRIASRTLAAAAALMLVAGCSAPTGDTGEGTDGAHGSHAGPGLDISTKQVEPETLLSGYDVDAQDARAVVEALDSTHDDREQGLIGSVGYHDIVLASADGLATLPTPEDEFYLAVAPFETTTHQCFEHNLAGCQGELVETAVQVTVTGADGEVLVDEEKTTYANGFFGLWLPKDIEGTILVEVDGKTATTDFATGPDDPTCLTTMRLA